MSSDDSPPSTPPRPLLSSDDTSADVSYLSAPFTDSPVFHPSVIRQREGESEFDARERVASLHRRRAKFVSDTRLHRQQEFTDFLASPARARLVAETQARFAAFAAAVTARRQADEDAADAAWYCTQMDLMAPTPSPAPQ